MYIALYIHAKNILGLVFCVNILLLKEDAFRKYAMYIVLRDVLR